MKQKYNNKTKQVIQISKSDYDYLKRKIPMWRVSLISLTTGVVLTGILFLIINYFS